MPSETKSETKITKSEFEERWNLIEGMLDKICPFKEGMPDTVRDSVDSDRQTLVMQAGWNKMPIEELRKLAR